MALLGSRTDVVAPGVSLHQVLCAQLRLVTLDLPAQRRTPGESGPSTQHTRSSRRGTQRTPELGPPGDLRRPCHRGRTHTARRGVAGHPSCPAHPRSRQAGQTGSVDQVVLGLLALHLVQALPARELTDIGHP